MARDWIQTLEGRKLTPRDLLPEQVGGIEEIAHALAGKVRFTGQTQRRYSVAEHCVRGSYELPPAFAGAFLLHELSEVYLPDIAAPLKPFVFVERDTRRGGRIDLSLEKRDGKTYGGVSVEVHPGESADDSVRAFLGLISWAELERQHTSVILDALGLGSLEPLVYSPEVKTTDLRMLLTEKRDLCGPEPEPWGIPGDPYAIPISPWPAETAAGSFVARFEELFGVAR